MGHHVPLVRAGEPACPGTWIVSDWPAGQSRRLQWSPRQVRPSPGGGIDLVLGPAPAGASRPWLGGEIQSATSAALGRWWWRVRAPRMAPGAVLGLFAYRADQAAPWIEFDFEFVGAQSRAVRINVHMEGPAGHRVTWEERAGGPIVVPLGFDAALAPHLYEIVVSTDAALFRIDGRVVGRATPASLPGRVWRRGPLRGFANLWAVDEALEPWAGSWVDPGQTLEAHIEAMGLDPAD